MTRPSLAGIEQRTEARVSYADERSETEHDPEDYAALADESAADVPALTAAVRDVLALHRAVEVEPSDTICAGCSTLRGAGESLRYFPVTEYPCETVRALTAHLDLTDPEGDPT